MAFTHLLPDPGGSYRALRVGVLYKVSSVLNPLRLVQFISAAVTTGPLPQHHAWLGNTEQPLG